MKTSININKILKLVLKEFVEQKFHKHPYAGLCAVTNALCHNDKISSNSVKEFRLYMKKNTSQRLRIYEHSCHNIYYWKPGAKKVRINWLNKHIKLTQSCLMKPGS